MALSRSRPGSRRELRLAAKNATGSRRGGSTPAPIPRASAGPHLLEIVEGADLGPEDMDDDVARVDQHPVAMRHALDFDRADTRLGEVVEHARRDRADMTVGRTGRHNHVVGDRGFATEVDGEGVLGLHIVEAREDKAKRLLGIDCHLGDGGGPATCGGPGGSGGGQGSFLWAPRTPGALPGAETQHMCDRLTESTAS